MSMTLAPSVKTNATFIGCASVAAAADSAKEKAHDKSNNNRRDRAVGIGFDRLTFICHLSFIGSRRGKTALSRVRHDVVPTISDFVTFGFLIAIVRSICDHRLVR